MNAANEMSAFSKRLSWVRSAHHLLMTSVLDNLSSQECGIVGFVN